MPTNRRKFIQKSAVFAAGAAIIPQWMDAKTPLKTISDITIAPPHEFWQVVRQNFPLRSSHAYLNNGTLGPSPYSVLQAQYNAMLHVDTTGDYDGWEDAVPALAQFVGADRDEICLTHNVTEGINIVCWGVPLKKGDEVILCNHEHVGNALPWLNRAKIDGIVIKTVMLGATAAQTLNNIAQLINPKTRVIALPHMPCTQGQVLPVKQICQLAKDKGIFSFIDGAHGPGMLPIDLHAMGCDFYASCCHKWMLASKGTGFLYVKKERLDALQAKWVGGYSDTGWSLLDTPPYIKGYVDTAHRFYYGSMSASAYQGVVAAIEFQQLIGKEKIEARVKELANYFYSNLLEMDKGIEIITPAEEISRAAIVGFKLERINHIDFFNTAMAEKIRIRAVSENSLNSLRASFHIYNTFEEADMLIDLIKKSI